MTLLTLKLMKGLKQNLVHFFNHNPTFLACAVTTIVSLKNLSVFFIFLDEFVIAKIILSLEVLKKSLVDLTVNAISIVFILYNLSFVALVGVGGGLIINPLSSIALNCTCRYRSSQHSPTWVAWGIGAFPEASVKLEMRGRGEASVQWGTRISGTAADPSPATASRTIPASVAHFEWEIMLVGGRRVGRELLATVSGSRAELLRM